MDKDAPESIQETLRRVSRLCLCSAWKNCGRATPESSQETRQKLAPATDRAFYIRRTRAKLVLTLHGQLASGVGSCTEGPLEEEQRGSTRHACRGCAPRQLQRQPRVSPASNPEACLRAKDWSLPSKVGTEGPIDGTSERQAWGRTPSLSASPSSTFRLRGVIRSRGVKAIPAP